MKRRMKRKQLLEESVVTHSDFPFPQYNFLEIENCYYHSTACVIARVHFPQLMFLVVDHDEWLKASVSLEISVWSCLLNEIDMDWHFGHPSMVCAGVSCHRFPNCPALQLSVPEKRCILRWWHLSIGSFLLILLEYMVGKMVVASALVRFSIVSTSNKRTAWLEYNLY